LKRRLHTDLAMLTLIELQIVIYATLPNFLRTFDKTGKYRLLLDNEVGDSARVGP
jgi:hypothetical protein